MFTWPDRHVNRQKFALLNHVGFCLASWNVDDPQKYLHCVIQQTNILHTLPCFLVIKLLRQVDYFSSDLFEQAAKSVNPLVAEYFTFFRMSMKKGNSQPGNKKAR